MPIKLLGSCEKRTYGVTRASRRTQYTAKLGNVDAIGVTEKEAFDALSVKVAALCGELTEPTVMFDLLEPHTVWIAQQTADGWAYTIVRRMRANDGPITGMSSATGYIGGPWTRDECLSRMREHWYANNIEGIVNGIVALCTDRRAWVCKRCSTVTKSGAPYCCNNPACGADAPAFDW